MIYAFIDPHSQDLLFQNYEPIETDWFFEVPEGVTPNNVYIDGDGLKLYPAKPGVWAEWDHLAKAWFDPRDPAEVLAAARAAASMSRSDFLLAVIRAGILPASDAGPAARGEIPPSLVPVFAAMPAEVHLEAVVRWGAATVIARLDPILGLLAEALNVTPEQLDALFGIAV